MTDFALTILLFREFIDESKFKIDMGVKVEEFSFIGNVKVVHFNENGFELHIKKEVIFIRWAQYDQALRSLED